MGFWRFGPVAVLAVAASVGLLQTQSVVPGSSNVVAEAANTGALAAWCRLAPTGPTLAPETWWICDADEDSAAVVYWDGTEPSSEIEIGVDTSLGNAYARDGSEAVVGMGAGSVGAVAATLASNVAAVGHDRSTVEAYGHDRSVIDALAAYLSVVRGRAFNGSGLDLQAFTGSKIEADARTGSSIKSLALDDSLVQVNAEESSTVSANAGVHSTVKADVRYDSTAELLAYEGSQVEAIVGYGSSVDVGAGVYSTAAVAAGYDSTGFVRAVNGSEVMAFADSGSQTRAVGSDESAVLGTALEDSTTDARAYSASSVYSAAAVNSSGLSWANNGSQIQSGAYASSHTETLADAGARVVVSASEGSRITATYVGGDGFAYADVNGTIWVHSTGQDSKSATAALSGARVEGLVESGGRLQATAIGNVDVSASSTGAGSDSYIDVESVSVANAGTPSSAGNATAAHVLGLASNGGQVLIAGRYKEGDTLSAKADGAASNAWIAVIDDSHAAGLIVTVIALEGGTAQFEMDEDTGEITIGCFGGRTYVISEYGSCESRGSVTVLRAADGTETVHHNLVAPPRIETGAPGLPPLEAVEVENLLPEDWSPFDDDDVWQSETDRASSGAGISDAELASDTSETSDSPQTPTFSTAPEGEAGEQIPSIGDDNTVAAEEATDVESPPEDGHESESADTVVETEILLDEDAVEVTEESGESDAVDTESETETSS